MGLLGFVFKLPVQLFASAVLVFGCLARSSHTRLYQVAESLSDAIVPASHQRLAYLVKRHSVERLLDDTGEVGLTVRLSYEN